MLYYRLNKRNLKITFYNFENGSISTIKTYLEWDVLKKELKKVNNEESYLQLLELLGLHILDSSYKMVDSMDTKNKTKLY